MEALVIAHEPDGGAGEVGARLAQRGIRITEHVICPDPDDPTAWQPIPSPADFDLLVAMGSVHSLTRKAEISDWIHTELEVVASAHRDDTPILGVCFGGQLLAEALGGRVEVSPVTEIGWYDLSPVEGTDCPIEPGPWFEWHHDRFETPPGAELLARNDSSEQLFRVGRSVGTQFHPEIDLGFIKLWLEGCDEDYIATNRVDQEALLSATSQHQDANRVRCHRFVDWFLDEVACPQGE